MLGTIHCDRVKNFRVPAWKRGPVGDGARQGGDVIFKVQVVHLGPVRMDCK
jgi:hypothetical protein